MQQLWKDPSEHLTSGPAKGPKLMFIAHALSSGTGNECHLLYKFSLFVVDSLSFVLFSKPCATLSCLVAVSCPSRHLEAPIDRLRGEGGQPLLLLFATT